MQCNDCGEEFTGTQCTCGWKAPALVVQKNASEWIVYDCASPLCRVKIRNRIGQQAAYPICKWCQKGINQWAKSTQIAQGAA